MPFIVRFAFALISLLAFPLRLYHLGAQSVRWDELATLKRATLPVAYNTSGKLPFVPRPAEVSDPTLADGFADEVVARLEDARATGEPGWLITRVYHRNLHDFMQERIAASLRSAPISTQQGWIDHHFSVRDEWRFMSLQPTRYDLRNERLEVSENNGQR